MEIRYRVIGIIHSPFKFPEGVPIQASASNAEGSVEVFPEYADGIASLEEFSHIILIYHFHLVKKFFLKVKPYMDDKLHGVFATRSPARPNPIGISVVRLIRIDGNILHIRNIDIIDGTPLLDIKPYVPEFDERKAEKIGWLEKRIHRLRTSRDDGRFIK